MFPVKIMNFNSKKSLQMITFPSSTVQLPCFMLFSMYDIMSAWFFHTDVDAPDINTIAKSVIRVDMKASAMFTNQNKGTI